MVNSNPNHSEVPSGQSKTGPGEPVTVSIVQQPAAIFDLGESIRRACRHIAEASELGAQLVVFPEAWLTGYPAWVFGLAGWDNPEARRWYVRLLASSPVISTNDANDDISLLREAAQKYAVTVVMGTNERPSPTSGTIYNSLVTIGPDGKVLNLHRKLVPTHTERIVWAQGNGEGLRVVNTPAGSIGGLICWEHWNPLIRQSLHDQNEQIHVAAWPDYPTMHDIASRSYAFEGRCFVLSAAQYLHTEDLPAELLGAYRSGLGASAPEHGLLFEGGSCIIGPNGDYLAGPLIGEAGSVTATIDLEARVAEAHDLDVAGHSSRPDILRLTVDRRPTPNTEFQD